MSKGSEKKTTNFQDLEMFVKACIQSANDFLESARLLEEKRKYRIAYRLAVLALEEIGKSIMKIIDFGIPRKDNERSLLEKHSDDHIKKLFWALCTGFLTLNDFTIDEVRKYRELSSRIYNRSLEGFYVDIAATNVKELRPRISKGETKRIMSIAEARIKIQELRKLYRCKPKESRNIEWFLTAAEDEENAKLLFGRKSREKLKEINDVREWISLDEEEIYKYYLRNGWLDAMRNGKRQKWINKEKVKIAKAYASEYEERSWFFMNFPLILGLVCTFALIFLIVIKTRRRSKKTK
jgi:AbiV family abortive infection protein